MSALKITLLTLVVVTSAGLASYYYYSQKESNEIMRFNAMYKDARSQFLEGNHSESVSAFRDLVKNAPNKISEDKATLFLAVSLGGQDGTKEERMESTKIFKSIVDGSTYSSEIRAVAYREIAFLIQLTGLDYFKANFPEPQYANFVKNGYSTSERDNVYYNFMNLSVQTYPNSYAYYAIAGVYFNRTITNKTLTGINEKEAVEKMQQYLKEGDSLQDEASNSQKANVRRLLYRALAINRIGIILGTPTLNEREQAYKDALSYASFATPEDAIVSWEMRIRYYYANFLKRNFDKTREDDIRKLLGPYATISASDKYLSQRVANFFLNSQSANLKAEAKELAIVSPEFKSYLEGIGF